jgi:RNA polymerase sigma-70 factor (ECF subfamily)
MASSDKDSIPTRQSLLLRLKQWDDTAGWREFFETYWELIYNLARKVGLNDAEAQEVVQETVIAVARTIGEFKTDPRRGSFKSWLLGQARWRIGDQFRARRREGRLSGDSAGVPYGGSARARDDDTGTEPLNRVIDSAGDPLAAVWNQEWEQHVLRRALERVKARVSVKQFQMFDLHARQGLSVIETARAVGTTMTAVYMAKSRVGRLFRRELKLAADYQS